MMRSARRRHRVVIASMAVLLVSASGASASGTRKVCARGEGLSVSRIVEIDASTGPLYGSITTFAKQRNLLEPKEVVLTFDDGPMPWITRSILDTLDRFCTKATFFSVGRMAMAYPETSRDVIGRGHTLGAHTWSHPMHMRRMAIGESVAEIEKGFAAITVAAGQPIAPFFRFPGLSDSIPMLSHLQSRGVATFTVDVVSNDSYIGSVERLTRETVAKTVARNGGIILFHDIKAVTAKALPGILAELQQRGFRVVHLVSKHALVADQAHVAAFEAQLAKQLSVTRKLLPFYGAVPPDRLAAESGASRVSVAPTAVDYGSSRGTAATPRATRQTRAAVAHSAGQAWSVSVRSNRRAGARSPVPNE